MANHTRHFKIGFFGWYILERNGPDRRELQGLFDFLVRGMRFTYDPIEKSYLPEIEYLLERSEIDIAIAQYGLYNSPSIEAGYNYNYPFTIEDIAFSTRNPEYSPRIMALFQTLSPTVWLSLLASTILFTLVCYVALKHRRTLEDVFLHVLAICLNQQGNIVSKRAGEFILLCTWMVAMALFSFCFKSVLLYFLTFPPVVGVRTVPELAAAIRAGEYIAYTNSGNNFPKVLSKSPIEDIRVIGESMLKTIRRDARFMFAEHILENPSPKRAYVYLRSLMNIPGLYVSKDNLFTLSWATAVSKDFCCKDEMDILVHRFISSGIDKKIRHFREYYYFTRYSYTLHYMNISLREPEDQTRRKLTMTDLGGAFIILVAGHFLSFCALIIELVVKTRKVPLFKRKITRCT